MSRTLLIAMAATVVALALVSNGESPAPAAATAALDSEEQLFLNLINQYRQQNGLGALAINPLLQDSAGWMSADLGAHNYFSHCDLRGTGAGPSPCPDVCLYPCRDPFVRMSDFGYNYNAWKGENLAAGTSSAQTVFDLWKNSPSHNANMLSENYSVMGVDRTLTAGSTYGWYWTNDFGGYDPNPPDPSADTDGDGFTNGTETSLGTDPNDGCGNSDLSKPGHPSFAWPADLTTAGTSANKVDAQDLASFIAPVRRLDTSAGDAGFDKRWDLVPGSGLPGESINLQDLASLIVLAPPMLGNQRAFGGPSCPNP